MSLKIYGKQHAIDAVTAMHKSGRLPHSYIIYGKNGVGKKTFAKYLAMELLCEENGDTPCCKCRACRNITADIHPDVIRVEHTGKLMGFSVETIRNICHDAYIRPNNAERKIYVFTDAGNITVQAQNALLKLIEEPPQFLYFIFTAESKSVFLDTILSRAVSIGLSECTGSEAAAALTEMDFSQEDISSATNIFHGNIGLCAEYIRSDELKSKVELTKRLTDCIINRDEYGLLAAFSQVENDKAAAKAVLSMLNDQLRDTLAAKYSDSQPTGCYPAGAARLASRLTAAACERLRLPIQEAYIRIDMNVSLKLILSCLCGQIMNER